MNYKYLGLFALMAGPMVANAQITTLYYQGDVMIGTGTALLPGDSAATGLSQFPIIGAMTALVTVDGSATNYTIDSLDVKFTGSSFSSDFIAGPCPSGAIGGCGGATGGEVQLTTSNGAISGALVDIFLSPYHGSQEFFDIGLGGDSYSYLYGTINGACENAPQFENGGVYTGPAISPCSVNVSNATPGAWLVTTPAQAPEIDPASAASGLTLLLGGLAVVRGRRKTQMLTAAQIPL